MPTIDAMLMIVPAPREHGDGLIKVRTTTLNQNEEPVQTLIANLIVPRRPSK